MKLQRIQTDLERYYGEDLTNGVAAERPDDNSLFTFLQMVELVKPMFKDMQMKGWTQGFKDHQQQYRMDTVLSVQNGLSATHISEGDFKVSGIHISNELANEGQTKLTPEQSLPVEVTLQAADEASAHEWVR